jgi:hypothetical protein
VGVIVDVVDTVIVAVHVHGNDTLIVIRPVEGMRASATLVDDLVHVLMT